VDPLHSDPHGRLDRTIFTLFELLRGYEEGEITFEALARAGKKVADTAPGGARSQLLGIFISQALQITPARRRHGRHVGLRTKGVRSLTRMLVSAVRISEGYRSLERTYQHVRQLWAYSGVSLSIDQIRDSCREAPIKYFSLAQILDVGSFRCGIGRCELQRRLSVFVGSPVAQNTALIDALHYLVAE
jgi:hypothetical protein